MSRVNYPIHQKETPFLFELLKEQSFKCERVIKTAII